MEINKLVNEIKEIARNAGNKIKNERNFEVKEKGDVANIVTSMDVKIQELVMEQLSKILPEAKFIAEENDVRNLGDEYTWVIDPIDGTSNYAYDLKHSCISIALLYKKEGLIGVVYDPYLDEMFVGIKNQGAYLNDQVIKATNNDIKSSLIVVGTSPYAKELADKTFDNLKNLFLNARDLRRSGSAALDLCYIACGRFDCFYESNLSPWDYSAAATIIKEAGGIIDAIKPDVWGYEKAIGVIAGNPNNFNDLANIIK